MSSTVTMKRQSQREETAGHAAVVMCNRLAAYLQNHVIQQAALLPAVAQATTASKVKTTNAAFYRCDGALKTKAATDNLWTPTGNAIVAAAPYPLFTQYMLLLDAAGAATVYQSDVSNVSFAANNWGLILGAGQFLPWDGRACIGYIQVQVTAVTFTPGTTNLNAAGITTSYFDGHPVATMPQIGDLMGNVLHNQVN